MTSQSWSPPERAAGLAAPPLAEKRSWARPRVLLGLLLPLILALVWEAAVRFGLAEGRLMPPPSRILAALSALAASGELWTHVTVTLWRVLVGFAIGAAVAMAGRAASRRSR